MSVTVILYFDTWKGEDPSRKAKVSKRIKYWFQGTRFAKHQFFVGIKLA